MNANKNTATNNNGIWIFIATVSLFILSLSIVCLDLNHSAALLSPLWLTTATLLAALFVCPWFYWPWLILCSGFALVSAHILTGVPVINSLPLICITLAEAALGGWLLRRVLNENDPLDGIISWLSFFL